MAKTPTHVAHAPKPEPKPAPRPWPKTDPAPVKAVARDPLAVVGLDRSRVGQFDDYAIAQPYGPERQIVVDGQTFEHVADDRDGVWLYRHSQF